MLPLVGDMSSVGWERWSSAPPTGRFVAITTQDRPRVLGRARHT